MRKNRYLESSQTLKSIRPPHGITSLLLVLNDPPYGSERSYNGLRLAQALKKQVSGLQANIFLPGDAVSCAVSGQKTPDGYYNLERMIAVLVRKGVTIKCCGTCLDVRGLNEASLIPRVTRGGMGDLASRTMESSKVITI